MIDDGWLQVAFMVGMANGVQFGGCYGFLDKS